MTEFVYFAEAVDGKGENQKGIISASDKQDAEKQVKAMFSYPVTVTLDEVATDTGSVQKAHVSPESRIWEPHPLSTYAHSLKPGK